MQRTNAKLNQNYVNGASPNQYDHDMLLLMHKPKNGNAGSLHGQLIRYIEKLNKSYFKQKKRHVSTVRINVNDYDDADMIISPMYIHMLHTIKENIPNSDYLVDSIRDDFEAFDWVAMGFQEQHIYNLEIAQDYNDLTDMVIEFIQTTQDKPLDPKYKDSNKKRFNHTIIRKPQWAKKIA